MRTSVKNRACKPRDYVNALESGLRTIEAFGAEDPAMTLASVARKTGLTRAAARRHLLTLTQLGYLEHDGRHFRVTPRVVQLGQSYFSTTSLPRMAQPLLDRIGQKTSEVASLAVLDADEVVYVARSAPRRIVAVVGVGVRLPAVITGTGRVLLVNQAGADISELIARLTPIEKRTPRTKVSHALLRAELDFARDRDYSINDEEIELGLRSVSVPVRTVSGQTIAAMSVSTPPGRLTMSEMVRDYLPILRDAAQQLGKSVYS
jgi:IclR family pca regulon transcriptional regulator